MAKSDGQVSQRDVASCEVEELRRTVAQEQEQNIRLRAEFENYRRRAARDREAAFAAGRRDALRHLLPVLDALERALASGSSDGRFYEGIVATERLFVLALRAAGAEPIDSVGRPFDPKEHEAVSTERADGFAPGMVVRVLRRGWRLGDELLRPAQVVVASASGLTEHRG